jgi:hypothetical protein
MSERDAILCPMCDAALAPEAAACASCGVALLWCPSCACCNPAAALSCRECLYQFRPVPVQAAPALADPPPPQAPAAAPEAPPTPATPEKSALTNLTDLFQSVLSSLGPAAPAPLPPPAAPAPATVPAPAQPTSPPVVQTPAPVHAVQTVPPSTASVPAVVVTPAPTGPAPLQIRYAVGHGHRRYQQSLLQLSVSAPFAPGEITARLDVAGLASAAPVLLQLGPADEVSCDGIAFTPQVAGRGEVRIAVTVEGPSGVPVGRWTGQVVLAIQDERKENIRVEGDMIVMESSRSGGLLRRGNDPDDVAGLLAAAGGPASWSLLELRPDTAFARRLARACPVYPAPVPPEGFLAANGEPFATLLTVRDEDAGAAHHVAVLVGTSAGFGRGGLASPTWRVRPAPYDYDCHARLSGEHLAVVLRGGRAWVIDHSRNGTWLNRARLERRHPELLADGDELALLTDRVVPLRVRLAGDARGVHAVALQRADGLEGRLSYLLTTGRAPAPLFEPGAEQPALWLCWRVRAGAGPAAVAVVLSGPDATAVEEDRLAAVGGRYHLVWRRSPVSLDQEQLLRAFAGSPGVPRGKEIEPCR